MLNFVIIVTLTIKFNCVKKSFICKLQITKTKHIWCTARINGKNAVLLIDTGASSSCIHSELQEHYKLIIRGESFDAAGASAGKMKATLTSKCKLDLGKEFAGKHAFVLLDLNHVNQTLQSQGARKIDGILGADFLKRKKAVIDYGQRMLFF